MLEARGVAVSTTVRQRILSSTVLVELEAWLRRAVLVTDPAALFEQ